MRSHRYRCPACEETKDVEEYYRRWPRERELDQIEMIQKVIDGDDLLSGETQSEIEFS